MWNYPQCENNLTRNTIKAMISYEPLWKTMNNKHVTQYRLLKSGIDNKTLDSLKKGKNITLLTVEKICIILNCKPEEVFCFINENE